VSPATEVSTEPTWDYNDLILFVFLAVLCVGAAQLLTFLVSNGLHLSKGDRVLALMPSQLLLYALLFVALYSILKLQYGRPFLTSLAWVDFPFSAMTAIMFGVLLAVLNVVASQLLHTPEVDTPVKHLLEHRLTVGPLCEELVFRGFMQPVFVRSAGATFGILITAICFGSLHLAQNGFAWQSGVLIAIAGIAFGWMRQLSGSTRASTLMHSAYNFTIFLPVFFQNK